MRFVPVYNRVASCVDLEASGDAHNVDISVSPAAICVRNLIRRFSMPRQLVPLSQYVKEAQERGEDLHSLYIDPNDIAELDEDDTEDDTEDED